MLIFFAIISSIVFFIIYWIIFIHPPFLYRKKLSFKIRETIFPYIIDIDKTIITISSAAIVLTVTFITKPLANKQYLIISWISFILCILFGIIILITHYSQRLIDNVMISEAEKLNIGDKSEKDKNQNVDKFDELLNMIKKQSFLTSLLFCLIYLQTVCLFCALLSLILFGIKIL
jgi:hypothetical protein